MFFRLVVGQGLRLTLSGLVIGLVLSLTLTRFLRSQLFGISSHGLADVYGRCGAAVRGRACRLLHSRAAGLKG